MKNSLNLARAAQRTWEEHGSKASLVMIADAAGVGIATLFRHYPDKAALARGALEQGFLDYVAPVINRAMGYEDAFRGATVVLEAGLTEMSRQRNTLAVSDAASTTTRAIGAYLSSLEVLLRKAATQGRIREALTSDDIDRIMIMMAGVIWTLEPDAPGWRRYLTIILDGLTASEASALPATAPITQALGDIRSRARGDATGS